MKKKHENKGFFIGFIGVPGVGKSTVASALANRIGAEAFIEPGEESHPVNYENERWQDKVAILEKWVCETNLKNFQEARLLANAGNITIADAGIFLVNKELIYAPSFSWWYGLISKEESDRIYETALSDWVNAPCPDVLVLFETNAETWLRFLQQRGRHSDADETCVGTYLDQQAVMAQAAEKFANERGISFIKFNNEYASPEKSAELLHDTLSPLILECSDDETETNIAAFLTQKGFLATSNTRLQLDMNLPEIPDSTLQGKSLG